MENSYTKVLEVVPISETQIESNNENLLADIRWENLNIESSKKVNILNNLNGTINGGFCGILGESGSGKSMFLSSLSMRINKFLFKTTGDISINGIKMTPHSIKQKTCYVMQNDEFFDKLTVYDTLFYSAELRMCHTIPLNYKIQKIEELLIMLKLEKCRNTIVGNPGKGYGISYGEKKRLSIAIEMLTDPLILFVDEPVSGLDSYNLLNIMTILKNISKTKTVVCSIHQPQNNVYDLFDNVIFMNNGEISYNGPRENALKYYNSIGYNCDNVTNEPEHIINLLSNPNLNLQLINIYDKRESILEKDYGNTSQLFSYREIVPWYKQFTILFRRNMTLLKNDWYSVVLNIFITILTAIFIGMSVWNNMGQNKASVSKRYAALFYCATHQGIVYSIQGSHSFPLERNIMLRERFSGTYYVSAYYLSKVFAEFIVQMTCPVIFSLIVYFLVGFQNSAKQFFIFMAFMMLGSASSTSLANCISCVFIDLRLSTVVLAFSMEWIRLYGGWFISPALLSNYPAWIFADALSYIKYIMIGIALNENNNLLIKCDANELVNGKCSGVLGLTTQQFTGDQINNYYGYSRYTINYCAGMLIVYIIVSRLIGYLGLRFIKI